jgi:hypothetical protein
VYLNWLMDDNRFVDFLLYHLLVFDYGGFVMDMHWLH